MGRKAQEIPSNTAEYYRNYYHAHNDEITCSCGHIVKKYAIYKHRKTKTHLFITEVARLKEELLIANSPPLGIPETLESLGEK